MNVHSHIIVPGEWEDAFPVTAEIEMVLGEKKVKRIYEAFHEEIGLGGSAPPRSRRPS